MAIASEKDALRARIRTSRSVSPEADASRLACLQTELAGFEGVVACYASVGTEPDTWGLLDYLSARGVRVLLPVLRRHPDWAAYSSRDEMVPAWRGILEPTSPRLGAQALSEADLIICSGLAGGRDGTRLGGGGAWYDRALEHRRLDAQVWCLLNASELFDTVPHEPHDRRVDAFVTEAGLVRV